MLRLLDREDINQQVKYQLALETFAIFMDYDSLDEANFIWLRFDDYFRA
jgi:hypothetical protein